jgi:hypothetical protein
MIAKLKIATASMSRGIFLVDDYDVFSERVEIQPLRGWDVRLLRQSDIRQEAVLLPMHLGR